MGFRFWGTEFLPHSPKTHHPSPITHHLRGANMSERDYGPNALPVRYPDPDIIILEPRFAQYRVGNTTIKRLWTGALWAEGPAWNGGSRYLVWSDIPNNRQMRYLDEDGYVSQFRSPS